MYVIIPDTMFDFVHDMVNRKGIDLSKQHLEGMKENETTDLATSNG